MVKSAQVERNVRLKDNRKMARSLETEAAVRNALKHWKIGGFRDDVVEIQKCHLPPNIQRIGIAPSFGTEVSSDDVPIGSDDVPMTDDVPIAVKRQRECTPPPANSLKTPPANCLKTRPCKWFGQGGGCKRGFTCHFAHDEKDVIARKNSAFRQT